MANVTVLSCRQMAGSLDDIRVAVRQRQMRTAMTTFTTLGDARMDIAHKDRICKASGYGCVNMTLATLRLCRNMIGRFWCGDTGVMAGRTIARINTCMVESNARKGRKVACAMTGRAVQIGRHVILWLAAGNRIVMT